MYRNGQINVPVTTGAQYVNVDADTPATPFIQNNRN